MNERIKTFDKNSRYPPGHYYSPIVSVDDIKLREEEIWSGHMIDGVVDIDLNTDGQRRLVIEELSKYYPSLPFKEKASLDLRYGFENEMYSFTDGIILYAMIRYLEPKKIIEVGSGHSSALMLDVNKLFFDNKIDLSFIEPNPERLYDTISETDKNKTTILVRNVQEVELSFFAKLEKNDVLFIDSTHVSKCGSDLNYILFEILPVLSAGVFIHFHDIFYPFEYPKDWVYQGRNWNENYLLRAFLMHNDTYEIKLFSHYLHQHHSDVFENMPLAYNNFGGNLWLEKLK